MKQFNRESVTDLNMKLISMLGYIVFLYDNCDQFLICGTLHTHMTSPTRHFSVTNGDRQWVFSYDEISDVNEMYFQINLYQYNRTIP